MSKIGQGQGNKLPESGKVCAFNPIELLEAARKYVELEARGLKTRMQIATSAPLRSEVVQHDLQAA